MDSEISKATISNRDRAFFRGFKAFCKDVRENTPFLEMVALLVVLWLVFSGLLYLAEIGRADSTIQTYLDALYWSVAAFTTAGIANPPITALAKILGAIWIIIGSMLFFGIIVSTINGYFIRPFQRPSRRIIETIEMSLEQIDELSLEELELLQDTVDSLIDHVQAARRKQSGK